MKNPTTKAAEKLGVAITILNEALRNGRICVCQECGNQHSVCPISRKDFEKMQTAVQQAHGILSRPSEA